MSGLGRQVLAWGAFGAVMAGGWALMTYTVPTKEQMLKRLPDEALSQMSETERKNAQVMEALQDTAKSSEPVWMRNKNSDKPNVNSKSNDLKRT